MVFDNADSPSSIKLVRGCPCFKVFDGETLCVNNDEVLEVDHIEIDPTIFSFNRSKADMEKERAEEGNICYSSIYVNFEDNRVYCISQGWKLRIHGRDVPAQDLLDALQFLSTKDMTASAEICSECLYKFLLTLADTFADTMTKAEKAAEIKSYVDKFSLMIAVKHSQVDSLMHPIGDEDDIEEGIDHFAFLRKYLVQLLEQQQYWMNLENSLRKENAEEWLVDLVRNRELLARYEFQFYSQTLQLREVQDYNILLRMLSFILKTADQILLINKDIHNEIRSARFAEKIKQDKRLEPLAAYAEKSRIVEHNFGNIFQILIKV
ncbi:MAG: hypothetical protein ACTSYL_02040 [Candidatus Thorarchaeota archaeon]